MKTKISIHDFQFQILNRGQYRVTYTSPVTHKEWSMVTNDMTLIDSTKNTIEPKRKDLELLKYLCKNK